MNIECINYSLRDPKSAPNFFLAIWDANAAIKTRLAHKRKTQYKISNAKENRKSEYDENEDDKEEEDEMWILNEWNACNARTLSIFFFVIRQARKYPTHKRAKGIKLITKKK